MELSISATILHYGDITTAVSGLTVNPFKLTLLIGWVYSCLYIVQRLQFSRLVPKNCKTIANLVAVFFGPILLLILITADIIWNYTGSQRGISGRLKESFANIINSIQKLELKTSNKEKEITLLSSSGKEFKEVYGYSRSKKEDRHILDLTEDLIFNALAERASDILIDPKDNSIYTIRLRVDGVLRVIEELDSEQSQAVINSIKAISGMDIAEKRRPQDGAFTARTAQRNFSFRVASAGVVNGEKLSIRVLNYNAKSFTLQYIGFTDKQTKIIKDAIAKPAGMILMCGPTGSGKTTTLYAMLNEIDLFTRNVITVEDPIECVLPNASQIEINPKADITFAKSLRSILRQDPDVICIGEIRDEETASIALRASQTGHLVLATIHSHSNATALVRLLDLGVSPMLIGSGLSVMVSQRLLRKLCDNCKEQAKLSSAQIEVFRKKQMDFRNIYTAKGCERCSNTGYYERMAIFDILAIDENLKNALNDNKLPINEMRSEGDKRGKSNLYKEGLRKVFSGITSMEEIERVIG
jgi:type II secretory ATPase GspE/PulE/Tfp pilus assembly ATPase PilB-like protein